MNNHLAEIIHRLFANIDQPRIDQQQRLDGLKRTCMDYQDPKAWYLTLELSPFPNISWRHNVEAHLGEAYADLSLNDFFTLIHPAWLNLYSSFGAIAYQIVANDPEQLQKDKVTFIQQIPLLKANKGYHWYDQIVVPGTINEAGIMSSHLNYYRELGNCRAHLPAWPVVYAKGKPDPVINAFFLQQRTKIMDDFLGQVFTPAQRAFLQQYRGLSSVLMEVMPKRRTTYTSIGLSAANYDKLLQRCEEKISEWFDEFATPTVFDFARWLNDFFGPPSESSAN